MGRTLPGLGGGATLLCPCLHVLHILVDFSNKSKKLWSKNISALDTSNDPVTNTNVMTEFQMTPTFMVIPKRCTLDYFNYPSEKNK